MRFSEHGWFDNVPDGRYTVVILDGIFGDGMGFDGAAMRTIEVRGDVEVVFRP
jgi:hypothetical protein